MTESTSKSNGRSAHSLSRQELRASLILPVVITIIIWGVGLLLYVVTPGEFNTAVALFISLALLSFLLYWTRSAEKRLRITAVVIAIPALIGISLGMIQGSVSTTLIGVGITFLLLVLYRTFNTPISYRVAFRRFRAGDMDTALDLVNKAIDARPDFWESYQLRALIHLTEMDFSRAERSAKEAITRKPNAHPVYNTLGQVYLAEAKFNKAQDSFAQALQLEPSNGLYRYHLGLCQYRQGEFRDAAASFLEAISSSLRFLEYELQAHYYLWHSLMQLGEDEQAKTVHEKMQAFADSVPLVQEQVANQPAYPHLPYLQNDAASLSQQFAA
ncbi:tetratricopeptide repeat protein [Candidatus Leptofilum sp.]|uniref:tetratricopeptide repeat protein n=1 Tax=Candidatus Leptofilum sp. TaxID=3241576 RepID=UPI003B5BBCA9